jgi:hypothetical protein
MEKYLFSLMNNNLYILIFVIVMIERIRVKAFRNLYTAWLFYFIGNFLHELSHFLVSLLLNGKPKTFSIKPEKEGNYYKFGSVYSVNLRWYNKFFISLAPLLLLVILYFVDKYFYLYLEDNFYNQLFYIFVVVVLIDNSIPSITDFNIAFDGHSYALWLFLICGLTYLYIGVKV